MEGAWLEKHTRSQNFSKKYNRSQKLIEIFSVFFKNNSLGIENLFVHSAVFSFNGVLTIYKLITSANWSCAECKYVLGESAPERVQKYAPVPERNKWYRDRFRPHLWMILIYACEGWAWAWFLRYSYFLMILSLVILIKRILIKKTV